MRALYYIGLLSITIWLSACSTAHYLSKDQYILYKQQFKFKGNKHFTNSDLSPYTYQTPNRRLLGGTPKLAIYLWASKYWDTAAISQKIKLTTQEYDSLIQDKIADSTSKKIRKAIAKKDKGVKKAYEKFGDDSTKLLFELSFQAHEYQNRLRKAYFDPIRTLQEKKEKKLEKLVNKRKNGNSLMRSFGEPPVFFSYSKAEESTQQLAAFMFSKGYFHRKVSFTTDTTKHKITLKFEIEEGPVTNFRNIDYENAGNIPDNKIREIILNGKNQSLLKEGNPYDEEKIGEERDRIYNLLKDNGYFDFTRQYIEFTVDTSISNHQVDIYLNIGNPKNNQHHQYYIENIYFNVEPTDYENKESDTIRYPELGLTYIFHNERYSTKLLNSKIRIKKTPGEPNLYSQRRIQRTQFQLWSLDMYKFVNINFQKNPNTDSLQHTLTAYIFASPQPKFAITQEYGISVGQAYVPGPSLNISFKDRNIFQGCEILDISFRYSVDGQVSFLDKAQVYKNQSLGLNTTLTFPQLMIPTGLKRKFDRLNPKSKINFTLASVRRPEYDRDFLSGSFSYTLQRSNYQQWIITPLDINIINTSRQSAEFVAFLESLRQNGSNLYVTFRRSIVTDFSVSYTHNNYEFGKLKKSHFWRPTAEIGGNLIDFVNNKILNQPDGRFYNLQYFQYYRLSLDTRHYYPSGESSTIAFRFHTGYAEPYGVSKNDTLFVLPYEKYYFAGGSSSNRGWLPRRLGPGSYRDPVNPYQNEQPAEFLIELNLEYRFRIARYFEGALFTDAGNVWTLRKDPNRPGSEFKYLKSIPEFGVASGIGLRLNFTFLIMRFDLAARVWDPGYAVEDRFQLHKSWKTPELNIGIGYPF